MLKAPLCGSWMEHAKCWFVPRALQPPDTLQPTPWSATCQPARSQALSCFGVRAEGLQKSVAVKQPEWHRLERRQLNRGCQKELRAVAALRVRECASDGGPSQRPGGSTPFSSRFLGEWNRGIFRMILIPATLIPFPSPHVRYCGIPQSRRPCCRRREADITEEAPIPEAAAPAKARKAGRDGSVRLYGS